MNPAIKSNGSSKNKKNEGNNRKKGRNDQRI